jgi:uncharacterized protein YraI
MADDLKTVPVVFVALSQDGQLAATVSRIADDATQTLILWDVATGAERWRVTDFAAPINAIAFNPNGRALAVALGQMANRVDIWDIESGEGVLTLIGHTNGVNALAFSPDGETLLTGSEDHSLIQWDMSNGQVLRRFPNIAASVESVAFSADGRLAVSASERDGILIWRIETLQETIDWTYANRYVTVLSCLQRAQYNVQPLCLDGVVPTATATGTLLPSATPTITPTPTSTLTPTTTPIPYGYISSVTTVNFRAGPGTGFQAIRGLLPRTTFIVLGTQDDWTHIVLDDGTDGWVASGVVAMGMP